MTEDRIRVVIAEDHATVRGAFKMLLDAVPDIDVIGEAANGEEAVDMARRFDPDVVLMDIAMPGLNGAQATRRVKASVPSTKVLVLTRHDEDGYLRKLFEEGADGYVLKQSSASVLIDAVRQVSAGNSFLDPSLTKNVMSGMTEHRSDPAEMKNLSPRETSVLQLVAFGYSIKEIAKQLNLGTKTVESAKSSAVRKLGISTRVEIVRYAVHCGWMHDN
jgi:DNA-binding NarL/FixJ family response regulator